MNGFFNTSTMKEVYEKIRAELMKSKRFSNLRLYAFDEDGIDPYTFFTGIIPSGFTRIDLALEKALAEKPEIIMMLTDNIQHPGGGQPPGEVMAFYNLMKQDLVEWVFIFPLKMEFSGVTYGADGKHNMVCNGQRAAILYTILLKKEDCSEQERQERKSEFIDIAGKIDKSINSLRIRCKPLEEGLKMDLVELKQPQGHGKPTITSEGVRIKFIQFNSVPRFSMKLKITSLYETIVVSKATIEGVTLGEIETKGLINDIKDRDVEIIVTPDTIEDLTPGFIEERYRIAVKFLNLNLKDDLGSIIKMAFMKESVISIKVILRIKIPKQNLQLIPELLNRYSTNSMEDPSRIYGLDKLVPVLAEKDAVEIEKPIRFFIDMPYPSWPKWAFFGLLAIIVLVAFLGFISYKGMKKIFILRINTEEKETITFFPFARKALYSDYGKMAWAKLKGKDRMAVKPFPGFQWLPKREDEPNFKIFDSVESISFSLSTEQEDVLNVELIPIKLKEEEKEVSYADNPNIFTDEED
ncbi:MAG: hypothetical protein MUF15_08680 [Acidobacteria bacterium]|nr:hypothetical protein [Acidobacteriota bacterium]